MKNKKLEAIQTLHDALQHHLEFRKKWNDGIEIIVTEVLEEAGIHSLKKIERIRKEIAKRVMSHFDPLWWEMLGGLGSEKNKKDVQADKRIV